MLKTQGRTWDGVPLPKLTVADLKQDLLIGLCAIMMVLYQLFDTLARIPEHLGERLHKQFDYIEMIR